MRQPRYLTTHIRLWSAGSHASVQVESTQSYRFQKSKIFFSFSFLQKSHILAVRGGVFYGFNYLSELAAVNCLKFFDSMVAGLLNRARYCSSIVYNIPPTRFHAFVVLRGGVISAFTEDACMKISYLD